MTLAIDSPVLAAAHVARCLLHEASADAFAARARIAALADDTRWHSRATAGYTMGIARLVDDLALFARDIELTALDVAEAQRAETARLAAGG